MTEKYCMNCKQVVTPKEDFSLGKWLIYGLILVIPCALFAVVGWIIWVVGLFAYPIYGSIDYDACPLCKSKNWGIPLQEETQQMVEEHKEIIEEERTPIVKESADIQQPIQTITEPTISKKSRDKTTTKYCLNCKEIVKPKKKEIGRYIFY